MRLRETGMHGKFFKGTNWWYERNHQTINATNGTRNIYTIPTNAISLIKTIDNSETQDNKNNPKQFNTNETTPIAQKKSNQPTTSFVASEKDQRGKLQDKTENENEIFTMQRHQTRKIHQKRLGQTENGKNGFTGGDRKAWIYINRVNRHTTEQMVIEYIKSQPGFEKETITVKEIPSDPNKFQT